MAIQRYEGNGRMSKAVVFNNTIYLCGQTCDEGDIKEQTATVLAKVEDLLNKYGSDKENILSFVVKNVLTGSFFASTNREKSSVTVNPSL